MAIIDESLPDMAVFVRVVDAGSLSAAGRELDLSPAVVTKRLQRLERRLGARLLNRTTRRLALTEEGGAYLTRARAILAAIAEAEAEVGAGSGEPRGALRVTVPASFGRSHVAPHIPDFLALHPAVDLSLDLSEEVVNLVAERFDVAVRVGELGDSSLVARRLARNRRVVCASPAYLARHGEPRLPGDLVQHQCLVQSPEGSRRATWHFRGAQGEIAVRVGGRAACNNGEVIRAWALAGLGLAVKSLWDIAEDLGSGRLRAVLTEWEQPGAAVWAVHPHGRLPPARVRAFIDWLAERYGPVPYWERGLAGPS